MQKTKSGFKRLLALFLSAALCLSALSTAALAADGDTTSTWTKINLDDVTPDDEIAITMTASDGTIYALPNADASTGPSAAIAEESGGTLTIQASGDDYAWTFTQADDESGYYITSPSGSYLYTTAANNGVRVGSTEMVWTLDGDYLSAVDSKSATRWLGVYTVNPDWRAYTNTTGNIVGQTVGFWKLSGTTNGGTTDPEPITVETPSASYSEADGTVTFKCVTSGVTYYYSVDGGEYTALDGDTLDISGYANGTVISYYAELDGVKSDTASITITVSSGDVDAEDVITIAEAKAAASGTGDLTVEGTVVYVSGKNVYVQDETGGIDLYFSSTPSDISVGDVVRATGTRASFNGLEELSGVTEYQKLGTDGTLPSKTVTIAEILADQDTGDLESTRVYIENAVVSEISGSYTYLTQDDSKIAIYGLPSGVELSVGDTIHLYAVVGDYKGYQLLVASADDVTITSSEPGPVDETQYAKLNNDIQDGDQLIVYYDSGSLVMGRSVSGKGLAGVDATPDGDFIKVDEDMAVLTAKAEADGSFSFTNAEGEYLTSGATGNALTFEAEANEYSTWTVSAVTGGIHLVSVNAEYNGSKQALEIYNSVFTTFTEKTTDYYLFNLYTLTDEKPEGGTPEEPSSSYKPVNGDTVAIYYPGGNLVMTGTASGSRLTGAAATASGDTLYTDGSELLLDVTVDENGYYTFVSNDGKYLTSTASSSLTLADEASDYSLWELEEADGGWYVKNVNAVYGTSPQYIEYYNGFTTYSLYDGGTIYTMQFFKNIKSATVVDSSVVESIAQWGGGGPYDESNNSVIYGDKYEVGDMMDSAAAFTVIANGVAAQPYQQTSTSTGGYNYYMGGTNIGAAEGDYMQFALSTAGWGAMTLSFRLRATNAAPGSFQLQYSTDGGNTFTNFTTGTYSYAYTKYTSDGSSDVTGSGEITDGVAKTSVAAANYVDFSFDVPQGAENAENLLIRLVAGTERASGTGAVSGNIRIDSVVLAGSPIVDDSITGYVQVTPDGIEEDQAVGTELTMTSSTEDATILYRFVNTEDGSGEWLTYNVGSKPVLPELPAVLEVYATSEGRADSITRILTYAAGTVQSVKMTPNGGGVYIESDPVEVVLSTATEGATIYYNTGDVDEDGNDVYVEYDPESTPILLEKGFETLTIKAYAVKEGFKDSAVTTRIFTERAQETYNIYFGQMHSHTNYSDGAGSAEDAYAHATEVENLDFLAVTDHSNSFDNADASALASDASLISEEWAEGKMLAEQYTTDTFVGLFGFEMTWSNGLGHINTFNTPGFQSRTQSAYTTYSTALQNYYATLKTVADSISQFNHPGTTFGDFSDFSYFDEEIDQLITLIEVGNGEGTIGSSGYFPSYEYYTRALDKGWHVAPTNNQDNHKGLWGDANTARSVVLADNLTEEDIYDAMRNYRVYATEDNDLSIYYSLDGNIMGSILSESDVDDTVTLTAKISDPTDASIGKVEVIVNGGLVAAAQTVSTNDDTVTFEIPNNYSYYYLKVTEEDGDIAVTAPVWVGEVEAVGISTFSTDAPLAVQNQALDLDLELYNNEKSDLLIDSIVFTLDSVDGEVIHTAEGVDKVAKMDTASYSFSYTHPGLGETNICATVTGTLNGVEKVYSEKLSLNYVSSEMVTRVIIDGTHYNDYVTGYYGGNMGNFTAIAGGKSIEVSVVTDEITPEMLEDCALLIISAPAKKSGTANAGDYVPSTFEDSFIEMVKDYVEAGGSVIACGLADYQDSRSDDELHSSVQINKLLEAIGSTMSINDDEAYDAESNGGQFYRLYPAVFNGDSTWTAGVVDGQVYSQYSGCTVNAGDGTWLVKGFDTTYSVDSDKDGRGITDEIETDDSYGYNVVTPKGEAVFLACEETAYGGTIFVAGGAFMSDFEVDADVDDYALPYANRTIAENILDAVTVELPLSTIADVRAGSAGEVFRIQGYATAGRISGNAFFDSMYLQDETGGIDVFPIAEDGNIEIGTPLEVIGYADAYQGDKEIQVMSYKFLDTEPYVYEPELMSCEDAMDYETNGGKLIQVQGTVQDGSIYYNSDGTLAQFVVVDEAGGEATVFIDGYILSSTTGTNTLADIVEPGASVSAVGLLYMHPEVFISGEDNVPVLRVRDCDEIVKLSDAPVNPDDPDNPDNPDNPDDPDNPDNPDNPDDPDEPSVPVTPVKPPFSNSPVFQAIKKILEILKSWIGRF